MDKISAIKVFVAIAAYGSLTEAANRLGKSLPTVVRTLKSLEEQVGFQLFVRTTRKIEITREGDAYLEMCQVILDQIATTETKLRGVSDEVSGTVTVTAPEMFGRIYVAPLLIEACESFSDLSVELLLSDTINDVVEDKIDIAVRLGDVADSSFLARKVGTVRRVICGSSQLIDSVGQPKVPIDLKDKPCMAIDVTGRRSGKLWRFMNSNGGEYRVSIDPIFTTNRNDVARRACIAGIGFCTFLDYQVWDALRDGCLVQVLSEYDPAPRPVYVLRSGRNPSARQYLHLAKFLEKAIRARLAKKKSWATERQVYNI